MTCGVRSLVLCWKWFVKLILVAPYWLTHWSSIICFINLETSFKEDVKVIFLERNVALGIHNQSLIFIYHCEADEVIVNFTCFSLLIVRVIRFFVIKACLVLSIDIHSTTSCTQQVWNSHASRKVLMVVCLSDSMMPMFTFISFIAFKCKIYVKVKWKKKIFTWIW